MVSREKKTERFFAHGIENWDDYHDGYLNFGLWENDITDYVAAARHLLTRVGEKIDINEKSVVLDVGCGMGTQDRFFVERFNCKNIEAVDLTKKHIAEAKKNLKHSEHREKIRYSVGNACNLPFEKKSFTHVISIEAPVNFDTRAHFFKEAFSFLKPDGKLGLSDFYIKKKPATPVGTFLTDVCAHFWHIPKDNRCDLKTYRSKLEEAGFVDIELEAVEDDVIPGYYFEQKRKDVKKSLAKIRGWRMARLSLALDYISYRLWKSGIAGYVLVSARKPSGC
jgi:ubiquinone/menaquinone biosynthesis C-methylase UbiE